MRSGWRQPGPGTRRGLLLAALAAPLRGLASAELSPFATPEGIRVKAPGLRFLTGRPLDRLRDGAAVIFDFQLSLWTDANAALFRRTLERFVISYDLWEEKFAVTRFAPNRTTVSHLSAGGAESACVDSLVVPSSGLAADRPFWVRLELRVEDMKDGSEVLASQGISLNALVELFGRTARAQQPRWTLQSGPHRLTEVRRSRAPGAA
jgi:hypothetical protein